MDPDLPLDLVGPADTKIIMLILDGLGGLPRQPGGKTELESACTPNLDQLAAQSSLGLSVPAGPGITVGSGPGHLALFGYDPFEYEIGRGAMEALGVDFELGPRDVAARGNFCTVDSSGIITDRRAGRIPTEQARKLVERLRTIHLEGVELFIEVVKEHRFAFIARGEGLEDQVSETDPLKTGLKPLRAKALDQGSLRTTGVVNHFIEKAATLLSGQQPANMVMLRGFARLPKIPTFPELYGLHPAAIAINGMYRGVARLAGMEVLPVGGDTLADEAAAMELCWKDFDFFYMHVKKTDTYGEAGDFEAKVRAIEEVDALVPRLLRLNPDVLIVTGDHSSPAVLKAHSWHPVPLLVYGRYVRADGIGEFGERACMRGSLGRLPAKHIMRLALANAGRVIKYGA